MTVLDAPPADADTDHPLTQRFRDFVTDSGFPCVGAKAALAKGTMRFVVARDLQSGWDDLRLWPALYQLAQDYKADPALFQSLVVLFEGPDDLSEECFEQALWQRVQSLSDKDAWFGQEPDARVSSDPDDPHFSLSFGGEGFFVVGLHPNASRLARRFERPAMVFNLHDQFEQLRAQGRYEKLRDSIIARDIALAGSANPMLARHGSASEAQQYSGRLIDTGWACPYARRETEPGLDA